MCSVDTDFLWLLHSLHLEAQHHNVLYICHRFLFKLKTRDYTPVILIKMIFFQSHRIYSMLFLILPQAFQQFAAIKDLSLRRWWGQSQSALCSHKYFLHYRHTNCPALPKATLDSALVRLCKRAGERVKRIMARQRGGGGGSCFMSRLEKE